MNATFHDKQGTTTGKIKIIKVKKLRGKQSKHLSELEGIESRRIFARFTYNNRWRSNPIAFRS